MKNLNDFIRESNIDVVSTVTDVVKYLSTKLQKSDSFSAQDDNAQLICDELTDKLVDCKVMTLEDYYNEHRSSYRSKSDCDLHKGDIIIIDKNNSEYYFDLKVSKNYIGAISMNSIVNFDEDGYYILVNVNAGKVKVIRHRDVTDAIEDDKIKVHSKSETNDRPSNPIRFNGKPYQSEDFIAGKDLEKMF